MQLRAPVLALAQILGSAAALTAQVAPAAGLTLSSAYVWRGLTLVNRPVLQPEVSASAGRLTVGVWGNIEPFRYGGDHVISGLGGRRAPGFTEIDPYVEIAGKVGRADVAMGGYGYLYPHAAGHETDANTVEAYARAVLPGVWPLSLSASFDLHSVKGAYLEAALQRPAPGLPPLQLTLRLGASLGEAGGPESWYYERDGLTHAEAGASWPLGWRGLELTPSATLLLCIDGETRWVTPERARTLKALVGLSVGWPAGED